VSVRRARSEDIPAVVAGYEWLFAPPGAKPGDWDPDVAAERLAGVIAGERSTAFVAEDGGAIVGLCTVYRDIDSVRFGPRAWVEDLAVDAERRSEGFGKALLDAAKDWAREHGASHLELDSGLARTDAHRFYDREGAGNRSYSFGWQL
jgi:GNAT superfamily N-acetyltransferase